MKIDNIAQAKYIIANPQKYYRENTLIFKTCWAIIKTCKGQTFRWTKGTDDANRISVSR